MSFTHLPAVLAEVSQLAETFRGSGFRLYLVGGIVRDQLLDRALDPHTDIDLTTDAVPEQVKELVSGWADAVWDQGERFGTIGCSAGGREFEITTHRSEFYHPESRKPAVAFSDDITVDLSRRDFTVNAMAVELPAGELVDPYGGAHDLDAGVLRTPLGPAVTFADDPLRMLRAARFVSGYSLEATEDVVASMAAMAPRLEIVAVERRRDELDKLIMLVDPTRGLRLLSETGVAAQALPTDVDPVVLGARLAALPQRLPLRIAALVADDPTTADSKLEQLRLSNERRRVVALIVAGAGTAIDIDPGSDAAVRRFGLEVGEYARDALDLAAVLVGTDLATLRRRWSELDERENLAELVSPLTGREIMDLLELEEGPLVGEAMSHLLDLRVEEGPMSSDVAAEHLRSWWLAQPRNSSTS